jgi:hypothetical protein
LKLLQGEFATIDVSAAPDLEPWARSTLLPVCEKWYPRIVAMLPSDGFTPPRRFTVRFRDDMGKTPATTSRETISCNTAWFRRNRDGQAAGAVVHEMVHVVQAYRGRGRKPAWLVEGIADYVRWFQFEPQSHGADVRDPAKAKYDDSYRVSANFLDWVARAHDEKIVVELNAALRQGRYADALWKQLTGKTAQELGEEWKRSLTDARAVVNQ